MGSGQYAECRNRYVICRGQRGYEVRDGMSMVCDGMSAVWTWSM